MNLEFRTTNSEIEANVRSFLNDWESIDSFTVKTSGSTGTPKEIVISKEHAIASALKTINFFGLKPGNKALLCLSTETIAGKMMLVRAIVGDLHLIVTDVTSTPLKAIEKDESVEFSAMVPMQVQQSLAENDGKLNQIERIIIGGAPISTGLEESIIKAKINAYQTFGMTETISHIALRKIDKENSIYNAVDNTSFSLGEDDNLIINSPDIGIHGLETNDIVELVSETEFRWLARKDRVINSGGVKLFPELIESKIKSKTPFFIASLSDPILGEKVILCVQGDDFDNSLLATLTRFEKPKEIYFVQTFNYTESNKIDRISTLNQLQDARRQVL